MNGGMLPPKDAEGRPILAPSFVETNGYDGVYLGFRWEVAAGYTDIYDYDLTANMKIQGGYRMVTGGPPVDGDYMEMSVVDKDNATGMFNGTNPHGMNPDLIDLGLTVGVDVIELFKYIRGEQVDPADLGVRYEYLFASAKFVLALLYLRAKFESTGNDNIVVKGAYKGYLS